MAQNTQSHYVVLGIPADASPTSVRSAFRALAQQHHPDRAGPDATARFQRMVEAYDVLSDPERRSEYDRQCRGACGADGACLRPQAASSPTSPRRRSWAASRAAVEPLDGAWPPSRRRWPTGHPQIVPQGVLALTRWEARQGGRFSVAFSFLTVCGRCRGTGVAHPGVCRACGGSGRVHDTWPLVLDLPSRLADGDRLRFLVPWPDGRSRDLAILVRVV